MSEKSFAQQHWREFEHLSLQIIEDIYREKPQKISRLTSEQNDGGYDGMICFPAENECANELYKILLEAKLRSSSKHDLPLSDFAKTIIIAVNTVADKVYISTNAYFSSETVRRLTQYTQRTGLEIRTLDNHYIVNWLNTHPEEASAFSDQELLCVLGKMNHPIQPELQLLTPKFDEEKSTNVTSLIGDQRKRLLKRVLKTMTQQYGVLCVQATIGCGKTVFIQNLRNELRQNYKNITELNLTYFSDARGVFIKILSVIWGQSTDQIYAMSIKDLKEVTKYLGDELFPERSREALINIIHQPQEEFDKSPCLHSDLLLDYLREIVPAVVRRTHRLIIVTGVKYATLNALDFLCGFIKIIQKQPISFLIALEDQEEKCCYFLSELKRIQSYIDTIFLPPWDDAAANQFITEKAPHLGTNERSKLIQYFGYLPLSLSAGVEAFCKSSLGRAIPFINERLPDSAFLRYQSTLGCIDYTVELFAARGPEIQCSLVLLGLFDGMASISLLEETASVLGLSSPIPALCMCSFLHVSANKISVLHDVYTNSINKRQYITLPFLYQVLKQIESVLELHFQDLEYILRKRFDILATIRDFDQLRKLWMSLAGSYMKRQEQHLAYHVMKTIYDFWKEAPTENKLNSYEQYWLLFHLADVTYALYGAETEELQHYLDQLEAEINTVTEDNWPKGLQSLLQAKAEVLKLQSQVSLGKADYHLMLHHSEVGIALILNDDSPRGRRDLGDLWANKALALKHLHNLQVAINFLESGKELLWGIEPYMRSYYIHMSGLYSVQNPRKALTYFNNIKNECENTLSDELHIDHNIATMHFILGEYDTASKIGGQVWIKAYENHVPIEEGRADHLLGCIEWVNGRFESAFDRFETAYQLFTEHVHRTHLWPPLINLSTLCMEMGLEDDALNYGAKAACFLLEYHLENLNHLDLSSETIPKLYVGVLILLDLFTRTNQMDKVKKRLLSEITLPELQNAYNDLILSDRLDEFLCDTGYLCEGKRILKI